MGIVVTVTMLLGVLALTKPLQISARSFYANTVCILWIGRALMLAGLWNALWYGLRHLHAFWGIAALLSGITMIAAAIVIASEARDPWFSSQTLMQSLRLIFVRVKGLIALLLVACFCLYTMTLIQLNLGYEIIS